LEQLILEGPFPVIALCDTLGVSRAGYYAWQSQRETARQQRDRELMLLVGEVFRQNKRRYGARRIAVELAAQGHRCGVERVAKLLKIQGLKAIQPKSFKPKTTDSRHTLGYSPNLLLAARMPETVNQIWVADITYIPLGNNTFLYLALLMDLFSRRVIGWRLARHMTEELILDALHQAIRSRQPPAGVIHHSDRGGQYAGTAYRSVLRRAAMRQSMSRAASCYDNAFMESCFGTIKTELEMTEYEDMPTALRDIASYLAYYNLERRHSRLDYLSPNDFEALTVNEN
jgi:transposase InsO family protein